jgi:WD40 repeat protein
MGVSDKHALRVFRFNNEIASVAFSPSEDRIIVAFGNSIALINSLTGKKLGQIKPAIDVGMYPVRTTAARREAEKRKREADEQRMKQQMKQDDTAGSPLTNTSGSFDDERTSEFQEAHITSLAFSPDGRRIAAVYFITNITSITRDWEPTAKLGGGDLIAGSTTLVDEIIENKDGSGSRAIKIINTADGRTSSTFEGHTEGINDAVYNPDGTRLATCSIDGAIRIWLNDSLLDRELQEYRGSVNALCYSNDGKRLFFASSDTAVRAWDLAEDKSSVLYRHETAVLAVAASPAGNYIVSGSRDGTITIGDTAKGVAIRSFRGHLLSVNTLAVSPGGQYLATGSNDKTVKLWDMADGQLLYTFRGHEGSVNSVSFSPDSSRLASGSTDGTVIIWNMKDFN